MRLVSTASYYRRASDQKSTLEDGCFMNERLGFFGVFDGVSAAYSPSNPPLRYPRSSFTGGQAAVSAACVVGMSLSERRPVKSSAALMNEKVLKIHKCVGKDSAVDDVGGAGFALCQADEDGIEFLVGADCGVFYLDKNGPHFFSGFDEAAQKVEEEDEANFKRHLEEQGSVGKAWDAYFSAYRMKRLTYINKQVEGGFASLNGDPALERCWTYRRVSSNERPGLVLLMTDGALPPAKTVTSRRKELERDLSRLLGGLSGDWPQTIFKWRDAGMTSADNPHIDGWPEATMVRLDFSF